MKKEIMEKIEKLEKELSELKNEIEKENHDYELYLDVEDDNLNIIYSANNRIYTVGIIYNDGECHILSNIINRTAYQNWVEHGRKIRDCKPVEWRGGSYKIIRNTHHVYLFRCSEFHTAIYDFMYATPCSGCTDPNIFKYGHNGTPILH